MPQSIDVPTIGLYTHLDGTAVVEGLSGKLIGKVFPGGVVIPSNLLEIVQMHESEGVKVPQGVYELLRPVVQASY